MAAFYANRILNGKMKLEEVPAMWQKKVTGLLAAEGKQL